jgi:uncharacterized protein
MGVLTQDMRDILASAMLAFVATVRRDGSPSLSPKASTMCHMTTITCFSSI